jgi:hypothetical protein
MRTGSDRVPHQGEVKPCCLSSALSNVAACSQPASRASALDEVVREIGSPGTEQKNQIGDEMTPL